VSYPAILATAWLLVSTTVTAFKSGISTVATTKHTVQWAYFVHGHE